MKIVLLRGVRVLLMGLFLCVAGCSSFHGDWKEAQKAPIPTNDITGPWQGTWISDKNGHHGELRALISKKGEMDYQAQFHATFWKIFSYSYEIPLRVVEEKQQFVFEGSSDLGWLGGGKYESHGAATETNFRAVYSSEDDRGVFQMGRPLAPRSGAR